MKRRYRTEYDDSLDGKDYWDSRREVFIDEWEGVWDGQTPHDMTGREIQVGDWLVKPYQSGRSCNLEIRQVREVRRVESKGEFAQQRDYDRVFLGDSKVPVEYPGRCLIVNDLTPPLLRQEGVY